MQIDLSKPPEGAKEVNAVQGRMLEEATQLQLRMDALTVFINGPVYPTLDEEDRKLLLPQLKAMQEYAGILSTRIMRFLNAP
jgi:hypothetical protein